MVYRQVKVAENENSELWAFGYRIFIPELNMTFRNGFDYFKTENGEEQPEDSIIEYIGDEKDPQKFVCAYCNAFFTSHVATLASEMGKNTNPKCYIDDEEFDLWTDDD